MPQQLTERQNEIVDAALRLIAENGMGNLTIRRLSRALNVTDAALYYHFRDKLEIVQALVGRFTEDTPISKAHCHRTAGTLIMADGRLALTQPGSDRMYPLTPAPPDENDP